MTTNKNSFEVELRGILTKKGYDEVNKFLSKNAEILGSDDRETIFFIIPEKTLKVTRKISEPEAKIALKLGNIKTGEQEEIEVSINPEDIDQVVKMFQGLGFNETQYTSQKRNNYRYKGVEIAVKHSDDWGYHFEIELIVGNENEIPEAKTRLKKVTEELKLKVMSEEEIKKMCEAIDAKHRAKNQKTS